VRELGFRDLGGLVFDQHKFARMNEDLVRSKITALTAIDAELRALEHALDDRRPLTELREPGVSVCPRCGALHGSEARYCPSCGVPVHGPRAIAEVGEAVSLSVGQIGAVAAPAAPPPSVQPPSQLTLHAEPPAAEPPAAEPETRVVDPVTEAFEPPTSVVEPETRGAEPETPAAEPEAEPQPAATEVAEREASKAEAEATDGVHGAVAQPSGERRES
jgi:ribosomal protein L40E